MSATSRISTSAITVTPIASHSDHTYEAITVAHVAHLREKLFPILSEVDLIGLDEAQWLDSSIVPLILQLVLVGKRVVVAGLDMTFAGEPFGSIPALMAIADEVTKLSAIYMVCGAPAIPLAATRIEPGTCRRRRRRAL